MSGDGQYVVLGTACSNCLSTLIWCKNANFVLSMIAKIACKWIKLHVYPRFALINIEYCKQSALHRALQVQVQTDQPTIER